MDPHILFSTILHISNAAFAGTAHPRFKQISNMARRILNDDSQVSKGFDTGEREGRSVPAGTLGDVDHVSDKDEAVQFQARDIRLEQHVDLRSGFVHAFLHGNWDPLEQSREFSFLFLSNLGKGRVSRSPHS